MVHHSKNLWYFCIDKDNKNRTSGNYLKPILRRIVSEISKNNGEITYRKFSIQIQSYRSVILKIKCASESPGRVGRFLILMIPTCLPYLSMVLMFPLSLQTFLPFSIPCDLFLYSTCTR